MSTGLEAPPASVVDNNFFYDDKVVKTEVICDDSHSEKVDGLDEHPTKTVVKTETNGQSDGEETLDLTADIIDLLLCVQNDENARQNIESIMDQWDEMNLLNEENIKQNENNIQTKVLENSAQEQKQSTDNSIEIQQSMNADADIFQNPVTVETHVTQSLDSDNTKQVKMDSKTPTKIVEESKSRCSKTGPAAETRASESIMKEFQRPLPEPRSSSSPSSTHQTENDALCVKIRALACSSCGRNYSQLMTCGAIPKVPSKPYPCPFCRGNYYQKSSADIHMKVHMEDETLKCRFCSESNAKRNGLGHCIEENFSKRMKHDAFPCLICSASLTSRVELEKHIRSHKRHSNNYRKCFKIERDVEKVKSELQKYSCNECKKIFQSKTDLDFHRLSHNSKFTKIVDNNVLLKPQSNILDHNYGKTNDNNVNNTNFKMDENQNLKSAEMNSPGNGSENNNIMETDASISDYESAKLDDQSTSFSSSSCDTNSSYEQPNYSSSISDVSTLYSKTESVSNLSPTANPLYESNAFTQINQVLVSSATIQQNSNLLTTSSVHFGQTLFTTSSSFVSTSDGIVANNYNVLQQFLNKPSNESSHNSTQSTSSVSLNSITTNVTPMDTDVNLKPALNNLVPLNEDSSSMKVVNMNTLLTSPKNNPNLTGANNGFGIRIPASNLKFGTNLVLGQNGTNRPNLILPVSSNSTSPSTAANKNYIVMYVLPSQSNPQMAVNAAPFVTKAPQQKTEIAMSTISKETFIRVPSTDNKMTYLLPITNQSGSIVRPPASQSPFVNVQNGLVQNRNQFVNSQPTPKVYERTPTQGTKVQLDPGKLHTALPPPPKQIQVSNKRNILQLAYDDACKLIEDSMAQKSATLAVQTSSVSTNEVVAQNSSLNGDYTLLKQMLNSKPCLSSNTVGENSKEPAPVDISFTHGQVTFQYKNGDNQHSEPSLTPSVGPEENVCEVCQIVLSKDNFIPHLKTHSKTLYKCTHCQKIFVLQTNLIQHMKKHLQPPVFNCDSCSKSFSNVLLFKLHLLVHRGLLFICVSCVKLFNKKEDYESHLKTHNQEDQTCTECKRNFPITNAEETSLEKKDKFICGECTITENENQVDNDFSMSSEDFRQNNFNESIAERTTEFEDLCYACPYCDVLCSGGVEFKNHFSYHLQKPIKCFVCCETFDKFLILAKHMKTHNFARKFFCQYCAKKFSDRYSYQNHNHPNFKPYSCMVCEQGLFNQTDLTVHAMNHDMTARSCCNFCGELFESSDLEDVISHKSSHLKESIAECNICERKFILHSDLLNHISKSHQEGGKKIAFKCSKCNIFLSTEEQWNEHHQKHLKMDFVCQHCKSSFIEFNALLRHWIKMHPKKTLKCFKCSCCSRFFLNEPQWIEHASETKIKPVLLPYSLQQFGDRSFKLEPDTKKTYCCNQCNESFRNKVDIIKHMRRQQHK